MVEHLVGAEIKGFVFYSDGRTPAAKVPVRVWDIRRRRFVHETETNDAGFYRIPKLGAGSYFLAFDWTRLRMEIREPQEGEVQQAHHVIVVIPRDVGFVALPQMWAALLATSISEMARHYEEERPPPVSP